jgi:hypothetical protein
MDRLKRAPERAWKNASKKCANEAAAISSPMMLKEIGMLMHSLIKERLP